jgi:hypothetical protein
LSWWQRLLVWLGISEPGTRKEQAEDWIETHGPQLDAFRDRQIARFGRKNAFFQRLRGWLRPTDDQTDPDETNDFLSFLPVWAEVGVDVYEAPVARETTRKGYILNVYVTELDATVWVLRLDSEEGSLGWKQLN